MTVNKEPNDVSNKKPLFRDLSHPDPTSFSNHDKNHLNHNKIEIYGFHKMQNTKVGNFRTDSSNRN